MGKRNTAKVTAGNKQGQLPMTELGDLQGLIAGLADLLYTSKNRKAWAILTKSTERDEIEDLLIGYFKKIKEIPIEYSRAQHITDLITLLKGGNASVARPLEELLGFNAEASEYTLNMVNYADVDLEQQSYAENLKETED